MLLPRKTLKDLPKYYLHLPEKFAQNKIFLKSRMLDRVTGDLAVVKATTNSQLFVQTQTIRARLAFTGDGLSKN